MEPQRRAPLRVIGLLAIVLGLAACGKVGPPNRPGPMWGAPGDSPNPPRKPSPGLETIDARDRDQREPTPPEPRR